MNIPVTSAAFARLFGLMAAGIVLMYVIPMSSGGVGNRYEVPIAVLFSVILGLLIHQAAGRRREMLAAVMLELNKLRRIYHLAKNLSAASQKYRSWFTEVHSNLYGYLTFFADKDFSRYDESNQAFRELSYHIYTVPELEPGKESSLYRELLNTSAVVAASRQKIKELFDSRMSPYVWAVILLMEAGLILTTALSGGSRLAGAVLVAVSLSAVGLLWEMDDMAGERRRLAKRYVDNIARLELRRRDKEG
ncbi:hypothetical protein AMJ57_03605 [Parcubacteria bacterium SG8_24]|nr:MAG: hypothetical protein AMJ57_03605 [Parcubacteria bacterium SG8_24]